MDAITSASQADSPDKCAGKSFDEAAALIERQASVNSIYIQKDSV